MLFHFPDCYKASILQTPAGSASVSAPSAEDVHSSQWEVSAREQGCGPPPKYLHQIFWDSLPAGHLTSGHHSRSQPCLKSSSCKRTGRGLSIGRWSLRSPAASCCGKEQQRGHFMGEAVTRLTPAASTAAEGFLACLESCSTLPSLTWGWEEAWRCSSCAVPQFPHL